MEKGSVLHINLTSIVHNLICKVNKHVALLLRLDSVAVRMLLSATEILQTALNVKGYPHLPVSFHHRLQVYI